MTEATSIPSLSKRLVEVLARLKRDCAGSRLFVIADQNGLPLAAYPSGLKSPAATACAAVAISTARRIASYLGLEGNPTVIIEASGWKVLVGSLGRFSLLGVFDDDTNLGFVKMYMQQKEIEVQEILEQFG